MSDSRDVFERPVETPPLDPDRTIGGPTYVEPAPPRTVVSERRLGVGVGENLLPVRDRVQWGPILAGGIAALGTMLLLSVLGLAIGASSFEPGTDVTDWGAGAGIWGGLSAIVAFFVGGWLAAKSAAVDGPFAGVVNGLLAGAATLIGLVVAAAAGLDNLLGFVGSNIANMSDFASDVVADAQAGTATEAQFDTIRDGAWGTFFALALALIAAALGGYLGHNKRRDLIEGTG